jgi:zinc protease
MLPIETMTTPQGAKVYLIQSHNLPMVDVQIDFDAGERRDPPKQSGLADAVAGMTAKGVRAEAALPALDENQLGQAWADLGASFSGNASDDRMSFRLRSLTRPEILQQAAALAARQLGHPAYRSDHWDEERNRSIAALREAATRPATVANQRFMAAMYPDHPYGRTATEQSLKAIASQDLQRFHQEHLWACRAKISMVGDLTPPQALALAQQLLAHLNPNPQCHALPELPDAQALTRAQDIRIPFQAAQAQVLMGQPAIKRTDPDYFALLVGNHILGGGGFVSRLTDQVREKRGLSYSVYSYFSPAMNVGPFIAGLQTRPDQAAVASKLTLDVIRDFVEHGPTAAELKAAQDNLIGGFALRLDSNKKLLDNLANLAWHDLPLEYLDRWTQQVAKVSVSDIREAFQRHLNPDRMVQVVLGAP